MWFSTLMILAAAMMQLHYHPVFAEDYLEDFCTNPHGEIGLCKNLKSCEPLLQLIRQNGSRATDFIRQSICGFIGSDSLVCCTDPSESDYDYNEDNNNNNNNNDNNNSNNHNDEDNNNNNNNSSNNNDEDRNNNIKNETISIRNNNNKNNTSNRYGPLLAPECGLPDPRRPVKAFIVGGVPAGLGDWPWIAALGYKDKRNPTKPLWLCGGGLISSRHVLTAAHCIHGRDDLFLVRLGEYDLDDDKDGVTPIDVVIEKSTIHPKYNPHNFTNDVGVLRLQQDVEFTTFIRPICLPVTDEIKQKNIANAFPFVAGWGAFFFSGPRSTKLQQVQVPIVGQEECKGAFKKFKNVTIDHRVICGGFARGGKGACQGDSGGPVMLRYGSAYYAIAVISYGFKCATPDIPGVYSNTTSFLDFIVPLLN